MALPPACTMNAPQVLGFVFDAVAGLDPMNAPQGFGYGNSLAWWLTFSGSSLFVSTRLNSAAAF
eukprot:8914074-Karenia_brevis.AAC.1